MVKASRSAKNLTHVNGDRDEQKKSLQLRLLANEFYFERHVSKNMIANSLKVSKGFVVRWTQSPDQDCLADARGWPRGQQRASSEQTRERVLELHRMIESDPQQFYTGATAIAQRWRQVYGPAEVPSLRTIGRVQAALGLSNKRRKGRSHGAARYLCYPEHTIYNHLGGRLLEADFIGKKFIAGSGDPLHFIAFGFKKEPRLRHFKRIGAETATDFIRESEAFFGEFEKPDFLKIDNCAATIGSVSGKRTLSRVICFLLHHQVTPIFAVPRKPFSQASIEGNNSVFARNFWNRRSFASIADLDQQLDWFNTASETYTGYSRPQARTKKKGFVPKVYFIRQVKENTNGHGFIDVLNETVSLPKGYINYFVLAEWDLREQCLVIYFEKDLEPKPIKKMKFLINPNSKLIFDKNRSLSL